MILTAIHPDFQLPRLWGIRASAGKPEQVVLLQQLEILDPTQVAKLLGIRRGTVTKWITSGRLKASNIGRERNRYLIRRDDLDDFFKNNVVQPAEPRICKRHKPEIRKQYL